MILCFRNAVFCFIKLTRFSRHYWINISSILYIAITYFFQGSIGWSVAFQKFVFLSNNTKYYYYINIMISSKFNILLFISQRTILTNWHKYLISRDIIIWRVDTLIWQVVAYLCHLKCHLVSHTSFKIIFRRI